MRLYVHRLSPKALAAMIVAKHCALPIELVDVDLGGGEQHQSAYRALNPNGLVPALVDGDFTLWESNAIMQYFAEKAGDRSLWPSDPRARADVARWQFWAAAHLTQATKPFEWEYLFKAMLGLGEPDMEVVGAADAPLRRYARILEETLANRPYLTGGRLTLADLSVATTLIHAEPARMPLGEFAALRRWRQDVASLPAWNAVRPPAKVAA